MRTEPALVLSRVVICSLLCPQGGERERWSREWQLLNSSIARDCSSAVLLRRAINEQFCCRPTRQVCQPGDCAHLSGSCNALFSRNVMSWKRTTPHEVRNDLRRDR